MNKEGLIQFEKDVISMYKQGLLRSPIHLSGGNESQLINIFKKIKPNDWVFTTYRSHYHTLLKGVDKEWLRQWILDGKSIHVMNKEHRVFSSAIVGGCIPIALGVAMGIKMNSQEISNREVRRAKIHGETMSNAKATPDTHVYIFVGDMTANTGGFMECYRYAINHDLPITFVIEDNGLSTDTPTKEVWNNKQNWFEYAYKNKTPKMIYYKYKRVYPHYGCGVFVDFKDEKLKQDGAKF